MMRCRTASAASRCMPRVSLPASRLRVNPAASSGSSHCQGRQIDRRLHRTRAFAQARRGRGRWAFRRRSSHVELTARLQARGLPSMDQSADAVEPRGVRRTDEIGGHRPGRERRVLGRGSAPEAVRVCIATWPIVTRSGMRWNRSPTRCRAHRSSRRRWYDGVKPVLL